MTRRMVRFTVNADLVREALGMPEGTEIINIRHTGYPYEFEFVVEHADLPEVDVGKPTPEITPVIHMTEMAEQPVKKWDWNMPGLSDEEE